MDFNSFPELNGTKAQWKGELNELDIYKTGKGRRICLSDFFVENRHNLSPSPKKQHFPRPMIPKIEMICVNLFWRLYMALDKVIWIQLCVIDEPCFNEEGHVHCKSQKYLNNSGTIEENFEFGGRCLAGWDGRTSSLRCKI